MEVFHGAVAMLYWSIQGSCQPPGKDYELRNFLSNSWLMRRMRVCPSIRSRLKEENSTFTLLYMSLNV